MREKVFKIVNGIYDVSNNVMPLTTLVLVICLLANVCPLWLIILLTLPAMISVLISIVYLSIALINYLRQRTLEKQDALNIQNRRDLSLKTKFLKRFCSNDDYESINKINMLSITMISSKKDWTKNYNVTIDKMCDEIYTKALDIVESHSKSLSKNTVIKETLDKKLEKGGN